MRWEEEFWSDGIRLLSTKSAAATSQMSRTIGNFPPNKKRWSLRRPDTLGHSRSLRHSLRGQGHTKKWRCTAIIPWESICGTQNTAGFIRFEIVSAECPMSTGGAMKSARTVMRLESTLLRHSITKPAIARYWNLPKKRFGGLKIIRSTRKAAGILNSSHAKGNRLIRVRSTKR